MSTTTSKYKKAGEMIEQAFSQALRSLSKEEAKELTLFRGSYSSNNQAQEARKIAA